MSDPWSADAQTSGFRITSSADEPNGQQDDPPPQGVPAQHWRSTLNRWLLTLNPGRTQDEYEKAVRYFFETPGVPQTLDAISFDLLLAYRGSLAMRADRRRRSVPRRKTTSFERLGTRQEPLWTANALGSGQSNDSNANNGARRAAQPASARQGPLSPATVNIRLTALRQCLLFAIDQGLLPALSPDRVRSALRRLRNERRRPYQILAEEEWSDFLEAALTNAVTPDPASPAESVEQPRPQLERSPWGKTRAQREHVTRADEAEPVSPSSHDGRTGVRTGQRDHALISLALATGLRAIELSLLDVGDLVTERRRGHAEWWLALPDEKTKGQRGGRSLPLAPELVATLLDYIRSTGRSWENPEHRQTPLFLALARGRTPANAATLTQAVMLPHDEPERRYRRLRTEQIRGVIHRVEAQWLAQRRAAEAEAGDDGAMVRETRHISPHALRHSAAIALLLGDEASERPPASVEHVRGWLGHFDIRTTQRYLDHIESRDQRRRFAIRPQTRKKPTPAPDDSPITPPEAEE